MLRLCLFVLLIPTALSHANAETAGCYTVFIERTHVSSPQSIKSERLERAKDVRLTSKSATTPWTNENIYQVLPLSSAEAFNYQAAYWQLKRGRLFITWSNNGLSGVEMKLTPTANGFEGTIESFWDVEPLPSSDKRQAILRRRPC